MIAMATTSTQPDPTSLSTAPLPATAKGPAGDLDQLRRKLLDLIVQNELARKQPATERTA